MTGLDDAALAELHRRQEERGAAPNGPWEPEPKPQILLRTGLWIASHPQHSAWLLRPYLERSSMVLMVGAEGTYKSFLALHWGLTVACEGEQVVYLHAEGRGLWKRLRAWALHHYPRIPWAEFYNGTPFSAVESPLNLSSVAVVEALADACSSLRAAPSLIVVDTLTRNSDGTVERSNEDAVFYLNLLDQLIRCRYQCTILLLHHIGHAARDRARGPFSLIASTDANYLLERPDLAQRKVIVKAGRMKDSEPPEAFELEAHLVELDTQDEDGKPYTSLILKDTGAVPNVRPALTGRNQRALLRELERLAALPDCLGIWTETEIRALARSSLSLSKSSAHLAAFGLRQLGYLVPTVGGCRLADAPARVQPVQNGPDGQAELVHPTSI